MQSANKTHTYCIFPWNRFIHADLYLSVTVLSWYICQFVLFVKAYSLLRSVQCCHSSRCISCGHLQNYMGQELIIEISVALLVDFSVKLVLHFRLKFLVDIFQYMFWNISTEYEPNNDNSMHTHTVVFSGLGLPSYTNCWPTGIWSGLKLGL
jgi:hypothetical protein